MGKQTQSAPAKELTRKQLSRQAKDERARRWLLYGTAVVLGLALLVLAYGLIDLYVLAPRRPAATVNGIKITRQQYNKRLAYREWDYGSYLNQLESQRAVYAADPDQEFMVQLVDQQINSVQTELFSLNTTVLDELIDEEIVRQEAARRGITIPAEDLQYNLEQQFGYISVTATPSPTLTPSATPAVSPTPLPTAAPTVTPTPDPSTPTAAATATTAETATPAATFTPFPTSTPMSREQFDERLATWLADANKAAGFTEADLRALFENALLRQKIQEAISADVPTTAEQVHARHILFTTQEEAEAALERLNAGEDFAALATELSQDEGSKANGGDLGWFGRGVMLPEFENAAFSLPVGQVSGVIKSDAGYHLILVLEHEQNRELDAAALESARTAAVSDWFEAQRASADIKRYL